VDAVGVVPLIRGSTWLHAGLCLLRVLRWWAVGAAIFVVTNVAAVILADRRSRGTVQPSMQPEPYRADGTHMRSVKAILLGLALMAPVGCRNTSASDGRPSLVPPPSDARSAQVVRGRWKGIALTGSFTRGELEAIAAIAMRETSGSPRQERRLMSIERREADVVVRTGHICGSLCGGGYEFVFRRVDGKWIVAGRSVWMS
jgi:hypothetical protein